MFLKKCCFFKKKYFERKYFTQSYISWKDNFNATSIAFGDIDGDGKDEIAVGRFADRNSRYWLLGDGSTFFKELVDTGHEWPRNEFTHWVAFGDTDNDGKVELGVTKGNGTENFLIRSYNP